MTPKRDETGKVTVGLTSSEVKKLQAAWPVLEQLAYHTRDTSFYNVNNAPIVEAAKTVEAILENILESLLGKEIK